MSTPVDWETIRELLRDVIVALREVATAMGRSATTDTSVATALRDVRGHLRELAEVRAAGNVAALAKAREEGRIAGLAEGEAARARDADREADREQSSPHLVLFAAVTRPAVAFIDTARGKALVKVATAAAIGFFAAACAWGAAKLGISGVADGQ